MEVHYIKKESPDGGATATEEIHPWSWIGLFLLQVDW